MSTRLQVSKLDELCNSIIEINESIQSVAVINKFGRTVEKLSKPAFAEKFSSYLSELFCMHCVLQVSMGRDFDENYGPAKYHLSERTSLTTISFALGDSIVLVITNKNTSSIPITKKILEIIEASAWY